jgi:hypothetical protein
MNEAETRAEVIDPALKAAGWGACVPKHRRRQNSPWSPNTMPVRSEDFNGSSGSDFWRVAPIIGRAGGTTGN